MDNVFRTPLSLSTIALQRQHPHRGAFSFDHSLPLHVPRRNFNALTYNTFRPLVATVFKAKTLLQQNYTDAQTARTTQQFLPDKNVRTLPWLAFHSTWRRLSTSIMSSLEGYS